MDTWFIGYTSRWMTSTWIGDDLRERPLGQKDAAFMLTVPMFARYLTEVTAGQPLVDVPLGAAGRRQIRRQPAASCGPTMDEVLADGQTDAATAAHKPPPRRGRRQRHGPHRRRRRHPSSSRPHP